MVFKIKAYLLTLNYALIYNNKYFKKTMKFSFVFFWIRYLKNYYKLKNRPIGMDYFI